MFTQTVAFLVLENCFLPLSATPEGPQNFCCSDYYEARADYHEVRKLTGFPVVKTAQKSRVIIFSVFSYR